MLKMGLKDRSVRYAVYRCGSVTEPYAKANIQIRRYESSTDSHIVVAIVAIVVIKLISYTTYSSPKKKYSGLLGSSDFSCYL